jgi:hypothetical protein
MPTVINFLMEEAVYTLEIFFTCWIIQGNLLNVTQYKQAEFIEISITNMIKADHLVH